MEHRAGKRINNLSGEMAYQSFWPTPLPPVPPIELTDELVRLLVEARATLATLDGLSTRIPNVDLFISMYVRKEALMSSQIEGTQATLEDVLNPMIETNTNNNVADVINYIKATEFAINRLNDLPLIFSMNTDRESGASRSF